MAVHFSCLLQSQSKQMVMVWTLISPSQAPTLKVSQGGQRAEPIEWDPQLPPPQHKALWENELHAAAISFPCRHSVPTNEPLNPKISCCLFPSGWMQWRQHQIKRGPELKCRFCVWWSTLWPWAFICGMGIIHRGDSQWEVPWAETKWKYLMAQKSLQPEVVLI